MVDAKAGAMSPALGYMLGNTPQEHLAFWTDFNIRIEQFVASGTSVRKETVGNTLYQFIDFS